MSQIASISEVPARTKSKRQSILDAAKRAFLVEGVPAASVDAIAIEAGVSRQTVYNLIGDRDQLFAAVVEEVSARSSASLMAVTASVPDQPDDVQTTLNEFAVQMIKRCMCDIDGRALTMLIEREAYRYPDLFVAWKEYRPGKDWPIVAATFAKLARDGHIEIDDPSLAARQFFALIRADLPNDHGPCVPPSDEAIRKAAVAGVATFLRAFGARQR